MKLRRTKRALRTLWNLPWAVKIPLAVALAVALVFAYSWASNRSTANHDGNFDAGQAKGAAVVQGHLTDAAIHDDRAEQLERELADEKQNSETLKEIIVEQKKLDPVEEKKLEDALEDFNREEAVTGAPISIDERLRRIRANNKRLLSRPAPVARPRRDQ